jgi:hypothetical protein
MLYTLQPSDTKETSKHETKIRTNERLALRQDANATHCAANFRLREKRREE